MAKILKGKVIKKAVPKKAAPVKPELYLLRYAFPCAYVKLQQKKITMRTYEYLRKAVMAGKPVPKSALQKYFALAVGHIKEIARARKIQPWSIEAIREYFWKKHDDVIEAGEGFYASAPELLCELCRVKEAKVVRCGENWAVVEMKNKKKRAVVNDFFPMLKKGNLVRIHYGYVVEQFA